MESAPINPSPVPSPTALALDLSFVSSQPNGTVCTFRVTQPVGGTSVYADGGLLVIPNPSVNQSHTSNGATLNSARRAPGLVFNGPTGAARYLYAIGGDDGASPSPHPINTVEFAKVDPVKGGTSSWTKLPLTDTAASPQGQLTSARTLLGAVSVDRFIYAVGGFDGSKAVDAVERSEVLNPAESPQINDADLNPDPVNGLAPGLYFYRVAAVLGPTDANNPNGETLAGDEFAINVPAFGTKKIQVTIAWANGSATPNDVARWRIYRTSAPNALPATEDVVFETADASSTTFIDKGATLTPFV
jgi:hypothetical protein